MLLYRDKLSFLILEVVKGLFYIFSKISCYLRFIRYLDLESSLEEKLRDVNKCNYFSEEN